MSTGTPDERFDQIRHRIDALQVRAQATSAGAKESFEREVDALRRHEAAARAALRERHHPNSSEAREHGDPTHDEYFQIEKRLGAAEYELAAEIARGPGEARQGDEG
jgi:hypothetical protein